MVNPHDTPSEHSRDWDEREKADEESRITGGSGDTRPPIDWSKANIDYSSGPYIGAEDIDSTFNNSPKGRSRKIAAIIISIFFVAIIGMFLFGDGMNPFASFSDAFTDITESFRGTNVQQCKVHDSFLITDSVSIQGKIYLEECNNVLTVSGNLNESAQVHLTLLNPDKKPVHGTTFVTNEINYQIEKELHAKMTENGSIRVTVNGVPQGMLEFMQN